MRDRLLEVGIVKIGLILLLSLVQKTSQCLVYLWPDPPNKHFQTCPLGYWGDYDDCVCKPCHPECLGCLGPSSHDCLNCQNTGIPAFFYGH